MTLLEVDALDAFYGDFQALFDLTLNVDAGETVALIGANGAGKTTFLKCLVGLIESQARRDPLRRRADRPPSRPNGSRDSGCRSCPKVACCFPPSASRKT